MLASRIVNPNSVRFVVLTGPIASGKSTIGRLAVLGTSLPFIPEDVDSREEDRQILTGYYDAVAAYESLAAGTGAPHASFPTVEAVREVVLRTQEHFIARRAGRLREQVRAGIGGLVERHPSDDVEVFSRRNLEKGLLTREQFESIVGMMEHEMSGVPAPTLTIFLHADPAQLRERIRRRGRPQEVDLLRADNTYLEELNALYERWQERCQGEKALIRTDALREEAIASLVRAELTARRIV